MLQISVIHNNEEDRLGYLVPKLEQLVEGLGKVGHSATLTLVGPDTPLIRQYATPHDWTRRMRRAAYAALMFTAAERDDPRKKKRRSYIFFYLNSFCHQLASFKRSVRIEQEVHFAHASCLERAALSSEYAMILESDAILNGDTLRNLIALLKYLRSRANPCDRVYVDLAGGCNRDSIINSWCFQEKFGCKDLHLDYAPGLTLHELPRIVGNAVVGYLVSPTLAADLFKFATTTRTYCAFDWALNVFAARPENQRNFLCFHTTPMLFEQGSSSGYYASTCDPWVRL
jgi:hypothetical protein